MGYSNEELDKLLHSPKCSDRIICARHNYHLEELVNDKEWRVRAMVARQGFGLETLVNDEDSLVRAIAQDEYERINSKSVDTLLKDASLKCTTYRKSADKEPELW